jgi:hypothetical protein
MAPMSFRQAFGVILAGICLLLTSPARAEQWTRKSFLMPDGSFEITGDPARPALVGINASRGAFGDPINIEPHFYWAASDDLSLGISHQRGLCFGDNCGDRVYNDAGFDLLYFLTGSNRFELDLHVGIPVSSLYDPLIVGLRAGVIGRVNLGNVTALVFDPSIYVGFTHRQRFNNTQSLDLPFWFYFQATDVVVPFVGSAVSGPFDGFFDDFAMPLEGGILFDVARDVDIGFSVRFHRLVGSGGDADARGLYFLGRFRF